MDPKSVKNEEHREYLKLKDNPSEVSNSAIFSMVSDTLTDIKVSIGVLETKQDQTCEQILNLDKRVEKVTDELEQEQKCLRADFEASATVSAKTNGKFEERFKWSERMQKAILAFTISVLGFLLIIFGIPIPIP